MYLFTLLFELKEDKQNYQCPNTYKLILKTVSLCIHVSYWNVFNYYTCKIISEGVIIQLMPPTNIP